MYFPRSRAVAAVCTAFAISVLPACGGEAGFESGGTDGEFRLVQQPWEDLIVENEIVSQVLEKIGYRARIQELSVPLGAEALARGDADAYLGNWWPSQEPVFAEHLDAGDIEILSTLVTGTSYAPAVPKYVAEELDVDSLADLAENSELFGGEFLGIEPGTPGNQYISDAIDGDMYELGDWQLVQSSTPAMLAEVERRVKQERPVVFLAWEPHWMNVEFDLVYLEDPLEVWPGAGEIRIATRKGFADDSPNVARFLSQMEVHPDTASEWIHQLSREDVPAETIARDWIAGNTDVVNSWLDGVRTADGESAEVLSGD